MAQTYKRLLTDRFPAPVLRNTLATPRHYANGMGLSESDLEVARRVFAGEIEASMRTLLTTQEMRVDFTAMVTQAILQGRVSVDYGDQLMEVVARLEIETPDPAEMDAP